MKTTEANGGSINPSITDPEEVCVVFSACCALRQKHPAGCGSLTPETQKQITFNIRHTNIKLIKI